MKLPVLLLISLFSLSLKAMDQYNSASNKESANLLAAYESYKTAIKTNDRDFLVSSQQNLEPAPVEKMMSIYRAFIKPASALTLDAQQERLKSVRTALDTCDNQIRQLNSSQLRSAQEEDNTASRFFKIGAWGALLSGASFAGWYCMPQFSRPAFEYIKNAAFGSAGILSGFFSLLTFGRGLSFKKSATLRSAHALASQDFLNKKLRPVVDKGLADIEKSLAEPTTDI